MTRLTAAICVGCVWFVFAWISSSASSAALNARARATDFGAILMMREPVTDNGLARYAMFASILMLLIGVGLIAATLLWKTTQSTTPPASSK